MCRASILIPTSADEHEKEQNGARVCVECAGVVMCFVCFIRDFPEDFLTHYCWLRCVRPANFCSKLLQKDELCEQL
jgi:hypothetical protein